MQIILLERVAGLGNLGDVVTVKNGYARNFLIPTAKARQAKLDGQTVTIAQKAGVDGRLFGSVTNADIAAAIVAAGVEAVKSNIRLPEGPFKAVGEYEIEVALHADAVAKITVAVVAAAE